MTVRLPPDVEQATDGQSSANQSIIIDTGKHAAIVAICAALCGISVTVAVWCAVQFTTLSASYERAASAAGTEYRLQLNHYMDLEARQKVMADEIEELKHVRR